MNLLIESFEGGIYLVALDNGYSRSYVRDSNSRPKSFHCLGDIKSYMSDRQFDQVWLKQNTPYDEMCGLNEGNYPLEIELDWR